VEKQTGFWRRHRWLKWLVGCVLLVSIALGTVISVLLSRMEPILRAEIVEKLGEHFHARVELASFHIFLVDGLWAEGKGLQIWPPPTMEGDTKSFPPLIRLAEFRFHAPLRYRPGEPIRISVVELNGLDMDVPPKTHFAHSSLAEGTDSGAGPSSAALFRFEVDSIECKDAHLTLETNKPGKLPLEFAIAHMKLTGMNTAGGSMHFQAELTNPRPAGTIFTSGSLGPWKVADPGETPVAGSYRFEHADLSVFRAIAGMLSSTGRYIGVLRDLVVDGQTDTPDFRLAHFGTSLPLHTRFHAKVDGTNGDTWLQPVDAELGHSHVTAVGQIVRQPSEALKNGQTRPGGHHIALKVNVDHGRIEDFLRLMSRSGTPLLTGDLQLETTLDIPPGSEQALDRMSLKGNFVLDDAAFTSEKIQNSIGDLSMRGLGKPNEAKNRSANDVRSAMRSDFQVTNEVVTLPNLQYTVPGAEIDIKGTYSIDGGVLDFAGTARTQAKVSQMVGGWKGLLLKPADRLFEKNGAGTQVPISISGTRQNPKFGVELNRMKHTVPAIPGEPQ
jgi:AsmA-like C-terminal region